jgi:enoyl-CoA hydratase/carnithine racemase
VTELVRYEAGSEVATVTLDSPHNRNALSAQLVAEVSDRLSEAGADRAPARSAAAGPRSWTCSG